MSDQRPPYPLHSVTIKRIEQISPHMKRITVDATDLTGLRTDLPAQWLKVFVPGSSGRAYTVRRFDAERQTLDIDLFLHGDNGAISAWATNAKLADCLEVSDVHPRSGFVIDPAIRDYLLIGDETALPAIGSIVQALAPNTAARVYIQLGDTRDKQILPSRAALSIKWLSGEAREGAESTLLDALVRGLDIASGLMAIWIAGESSQVATLRKILRRERGIEAGRVHAVGYWKRGEADHRDEVV